ncbi:site-specific integrase [Sphaerisporangium siamense]|uniref:Integrase n=1 Tax=Sphaerisporangium siamense TaxID=795645 RepID=A0A7W7G8G7_9ACTN|nr:site-specific integrase [Sphaerisporangium siamense]MBB4700282.1 integrase [Sphaerisporangium siamense]GII87696.1 site-specific integrase [Sphaerisporangium siamense]
MTRSSATPPNGRAGDEPASKKKGAKPQTKLRDGVMKRGNTWSYVIRVKDPETGISKPKWVGGFVTEDEAKEARDEARVKARRGDYVDRNRVTVAEYLDDWIETHAMEIKPLTLKDYKMIIRLYVRPNIGNMRLQAVRPSTITKLYGHLRSKGGKDGKPLSTRSVNHVHAVLRKAFGDAVKVEELLTFNPVERAKRPKHTYTEPGSVWTPDQLRTFLSIARSHRLFAFFHLAAYTGARRGELVNLRWSNVNLDGKVITIAGSVGIIDGERIEGTTKSGRIRVVSLDDETVAVLKAHKARQEADEDTAGDEWQGDKEPHVFTTGLGRPIYPDTVTQLLRDLVKAYNAPAEGDGPLEPLPFARLHDLRHVHATTLLLAGVPVHVVAA